jgi:hypothetical protein
MVHQNEPTSSNRSEGSAKTWFFVEESLNKSGREETEELSKAKRK